MRIETDATGVTINAINPPHRIESAELSMFLQRLRTRDNVPLNVAAEYTTQGWASEQEVLADKDRSIVVLHDPDTVIAEQTIAMPDPRKGVYHRITRHTIAAWALVRRTFRTGAKPRSDQEYLLVINR